MHVLFEETLFEKVSLRILDQPKPPLVRLEVDGECETRLYEWGSLVPSANRKDLKKTLMDIATRACHSEVAESGHSLDLIQTDDHYLRLLEFTLSLTER